MKRRRSLARSSGLAVSVAISCVILVAHALYCYAQLGGLDLDCPNYARNSTALCASDPIDGGIGHIVWIGGVRFEAKEAAAAALGLLEKEACGTTCGIEPSSSSASSRSNRSSGVVSTFCADLQCDECLAAGDVVSHERCDWRYSQTLMQISYIYTVHDLWTHDVAPNCHSGFEESCTGYHPGRIGSWALIISSFVWPHVKLLLLHLVFYVPLLPRTRRKACYWLALLGKWTILDVLLMSSVTALNQVHVDAALLGLWAQVPRALPEAGRICLAGCANLIQRGELPPFLNCTTTCEGLYDVLSAAVASPHELPHANIYLSLPLSLQECMVAFCVAVVLSVSCGVLIERLDERPLRSITSSSKRARGGGGGGTSSSSSNNTAPPEAGGAFVTADSLLQEGTLGSDLLGAEGEEVVAPSSVATTTTTIRRLSPGCLTVLLLLPAAQLLLTASALSLPFLKRHVYGNIAQILSAFHIEVDGTLSVYEMASLVGDGKGQWPLLLSSVFWVFVALCPLLRPLTQIALLVHIPSAPSSFRRRLFRISRYLSHFCALEVFVVVASLLNVTFTFLASEVISPATFPLCTLFADLYHDERCLAFRIELDAGFYVAVAAVALHIVSGLDGSLVDRQIERRIFARGTS